MKNLVIKQLLTTDGKHPYLALEVGPMMGLQFTRVMFDTPDSGGGPFYPYLTPDEWEDFAKEIVRRWNKYGDLSL